MVKAIVDCGIGEIAYAYGFAAPNGGLQPVWVGSVLQFALCVNRRLPRPATLRRLARKPRTRSRT
jgi:hypothetical protein